MNGLHSIKKGDIFQNAVGILSDFRMQCADKVETIYLHFNALWMKKSSTECSYLFRQRQMWNELNYTKCSLCYQVILHVSPMIQWHHLEFKIILPGVWYNAWVCSACSVRGFNSIYQLLSFEKYKNETGQRVRQMHGQPGYLWDLTCMSQSIVDQCTFPPLAPLLCPQSTDKTSNCQKYPVITSSCSPLRTHGILGRHWNSTLLHLLAGEGRAGSG